MLEVVLIRPGITDYGKQRRIQGTLDIPLNAEGSREVEREVAELRERGLEVIYSSDSQPALQTAETIAHSLGVKLRKLDQFDNLDLGLWQGMLIEEIKRKLPKIYRQCQELPESVCPPEGEMLGEARQRVRAVLQKLVKRHREGTIGLVVPEPLASLVRCELLHHEMPDLWKAVDEHGTWENLPVGPGALVQARG